MVQQLADEIERMGGADMLPPSCACGSPLVPGVAHAPDSCEPAGWAAAT